MLDERQRFAVQVYNVTSQVNEYFYSDLVPAKIFAKKKFKEPGVYKVKVWDLKKGSIKPNTPNAKALVYELV